MLFDEKFASALSHVNVVGQNLSAGSRLWMKPMDEQDVVRLTVGAGLLVNARGVNHAIWICYLKEQKATWREAPGEDVDDPPQVCGVVAIMDRPGEGGDDIVAGDLVERLHAFDTNTRRTKSLGGSVDHALGCVGSIGVDAFGQRQFEEHARSAADIKQARAVASEASDLVEDEGVVVLVVAWRRVQVIAVGVGLEELMHVSLFPVA